VTDQVGVLREPDLAVHDERVVVRHATLLSRSSGSVRIRAGCADSYIRRVGQRDVAGSAIRGASTR
jgi:hypothetical protein